MAIWFILIIYYVLGKRETKATLKAIENRNREVNTLVMKIGMIKNGNQDDASLVADPEEEEG